MLQFGYLKLPVYCYMDGDDLGECGGGGWSRMDSGHEN